MFIRIKRFVKKITIKCYNIRMKNTIVQMINRSSDRVMESPVLDSDEMHTLVQVFKTVVQLLFETGQVEAGKDLGKSLVITSQN